MRILLIFLLLMNTTFACPVEPHEFVIARFKALTTDPLPSASGLTEQDFTEVLGRVRDHYAKVFGDLGLEVNFNIDWNNEWFNAQTGWSDAKTVRFFFAGALARGRYMTRDGLLYVGCHEIGHHFGGLPKKEGKWSTSEGGADYFAALKCMRDILKGDVGNAAAEAFDLPAGVKSKCREVYADEDEYHLCLRTAKAGEDIAKSFQFKNSKAEQAETMFFRPLPVVEVTNTNYPPNACRAETAFQGAICNKGPEFPMSFANEYEGYCHEKNGDTFGMRPKCWFRPSFE